MTNSEISLSSFPQAADFFRAVNPLLPAFDSAVFSFVSVIHEGHHVILRAALDLSIFGARLRDSVTTRNLIAGQVRVPIVPDVIETCLRSTIAGTWLPPVGQKLLKLMPRGQPPQAGSYSMYYESAVRSHERSDRDRERLIVSGITQFQLLSPITWIIDTELREFGISSVAELLRMFGLGGSDETTFEIAVGPVASIATESAVRGRHANLAFSLANKLSPSQFRCVLRNAESGVAGPLAIEGGDSVTWDEAERTRQGRWRVELPRAGAVDFQILYAGQIQGQIRLIDQATASNPRWTLAALVDPGLKRLEDRKRLGIHVLPA